MTPKTMFVFHSPSSEVHETTFFSAHDFRLPAFPPDMCALERVHSEATIFHVQFSTFPTSRTKMTNELPPVLKFFSTGQIRGVS